MMVDSRKRVFDEFIRKLRDFNGIFSKNFTFLMNGEANSEHHFDPSFLKSYSLFPHELKRQESESLDDGGSQIRSFHDDLHPYRENGNTNNEPDHDMPEDDGQENSDKISFKEEIYLTSLVPNLKYGCVLLEDSNKRQRSHRNNQNTPPFSSELFINIGPVEMLINRRVTKIKKYGGGDQSESCMWIVGSRNLLGRFSKSQSLVYSESPPLTESTITETTRLNNILLFFKSSHHVLCTDIDLKVMFAADIDSLFEYQDQVCTSISYDDRNLVILGTLQGFLLLLNVDVEEKSLIEKDRSNIATRSIRSLMWTNYKNMEFAVISEEGKIILIRISDSTNLSMEPLKVFNYNSEITTSISFYKFALIAFEGGVLSIVELDKGSIIYSYQIPTSSNPSTRITWAGFFTNDYNKKLTKMRMDELINEDVFLELISKVKYLVRTDTDTFYIFGHQTSSNNKLKYQEFPLFKHTKPVGAEVSQQPTEPIFEKTEDGVLMRFFKTVCLANTKKTQDDPDSAPIEKYQCLMCEVAISAAHDGH